MNVIHFMYIQFKNKLCLEHVFTIMASKQKATESGVFLASYYCRMCKREAATRSLKRKGVKPQYDAQKIMFR